MVSCQCANNKRLQKCEILGYHSYTAEDSVAWSYELCCFVSSSWCSEAPLCLQNVGNHGPNNSATTQRKWILLPPYL